ncbi:hypothetical protein FOQG_16162 [Fusarium oxysporum f. sp. raphani 54005]|uniref:Histidine-specific methyltransferase SAM-dependent domain-containing protein n=1 Tax=Fusarium oxysporum f. sp. raphani 54005 TaxID=1089458 RepID=X0BK20_FUSOX|nr:hypothetical protein FOQG_16162 [Fusarium oxysporum f. sp. raphani 54005]
MPGKKVGISYSSTLTDFEPKKLHRILQGWHEVVDQLIVGQHEPVEKKELEISYHTTQFTEFVRGGWDQANRLLGWTEFDDERWKLHGGLSAHNPELRMESIEMLPRWEDQDVDV